MDKGQISVVVIFVGYFFFPFLEIFLSVSEECSKKTSFFISQTAVGINKILLCLHQLCDSEI